MITYKNRIIEHSSHGRAGSKLIKTLGGVVRPPSVVTCFGSFKLNQADYAEYDYRDEGSDFWLRTNLYFTYSRNDGPIQRVVLDFNSIFEEADANETAPDFTQLNEAYIKLDKDLCRGEDGTSLAFYVDTALTGLTSELIPSIDNMRSNMPEVASFSMSDSIPNSIDPNQFIYKLTGISGDGLFPISDMYNQDIRNVAIPVALSLIDDPAGSMDAPRWYPGNAVSPEENKLTIYPSEYTETYAFDLFEALGGLGEEPIIVTSCVVAKPRLYSCINTAVNGSRAAEMPAMLARVGDFDSDLSTMQFTVVGMDNYVDEAPFPFAANSMDYYTPDHWPVDNGNMEMMRRSNGGDYVCTYSKNGGPKQSIAWSNSDYGDAHHSVWDAVKALVLDDYGRTAFMLYGFNAEESGWNRSNYIAKSGISSNATFTYPVDPNAEDFGPRLVNMTNGRYPDRYDAAGYTVHVRDGVIKFTTENEGFMWSENTLTIYPTLSQVANDFGLDGYTDYYDFLCQYEEQVEAGEPIVIHSCGVVEPLDHIQVNTKVTFVESPFEDDAPSALSAAIRLNDGEIKQFKYTAEEASYGLTQIIKYICFMGQEPIISDVPENFDRLENATINKMYFRLNLGRIVEISGCSGNERGMEFELPILNSNFDPSTGLPPDMVMAGIVDVDSSPNAVITRGSNSATFVQNKLPGYVDLFDMFKYTTGVEHKIYSSASVPSILIEPSFEEPPR